MEHLAGRCVERVAGQPGGRPKSLFKEQSGKGSQGGWGWEAVALDTHGHGITMQWPHAAICWGQD